MGKCEVQSMKRVVELLLIVMVGMGPAVGTLVTMLYHRHVSPSLTLTLIIVSVTFSLLGLCITRHLNKNNEQTEDVEQGSQQDQQEQEQALCDIPPVYEEVIAKPPPYACVLAYTTHTHATSDDPDLPSYYDIVKLPSTPSEASVVDKKEFPEAPSNSYSSSYSSV